LPRLDVTIIRLLDGTRAYLHAVIDNYSRRILSWTLEEQLGSGGTCRILSEAVVQLKHCPERTIVVADSGSENVNEAVDDLLDHDDLTCVLAQVGITFSYSMIEAFWRPWKRGWLYFHTLDSLADARESAGEKRMKENRAMRCGVWAGDTTSGPLLLQRARSRMS